MKPKEKPIPYGLTHQGLRLRPWQAALGSCLLFYWCVKPKAKATVSGFPHGHPKHTQADCDASMARWVRWHVAMEKRARETGEPQYLGHQPLPCHD